MDHPALPDVLCEQLLLYLAFVGLFWAATPLIRNFVEFNDYNGALFTIRARGLNNFVYWISQIFGSLFIGHVILDKRNLRRRARAYLGWIIVFLMVFVVHTWAYFYQK